MSQTYLEWQDSYNLGVDIIDEQHKKLLNMINDCSHKDTLLHDEKKLLEIISSLRSYTKYHFESEEKLMQEYDYPQYDEHVHLHKQIIHKLDIIVEGFKSEPVKLLQQISELLSDWFVEHILYEDKLIGHNIAPQYNANKVEA